MANSNATAGMSGAGVYNRNSRLQRDIVERAENRLIAAVRQIGTVEPEFIVVDYGCGPGRNSAAAFRSVIEEYRRHSPAGVVVAIHNDQIGNDWNDLFNNVAGPDGYLAGDGAIRCQAAVGSFYESLASPASVSLGMSFTAAQWLRCAIELPSPGTLFFANLEGESRRKLAEIAARDWTRFLRKRSLEIRSGGRLLIECLGAVPDSRSAGGTDPGVGELYRLLWAVASSLADDGMLDRDLLESFVSPQWFRTVDEARAPLEQESDLSRAFAIEEISVEPVKLPFVESYVRSRDAARYASEYTAFVRGFTERSFQHCLFAPSTQNAGAVPEINEEFYSRLESCFRARPGEHDYAVWTLTVLLRRT